MYVYWIAIFIIVIVTVVILYKFISANVQLKFTLTHNSELASNNLQYQKEIEGLKEEKLSFIKEIEHLSSKIQHQEYIIVQSAKNKQESLTDAKSILFELGNDLSKQLIEIHRRETEEHRAASEQNINATAIKFRNEFERILEIVNKMAHDVDKSKGTVDLLKQSLLSPFSAGQLAEITLENILKSSGLRPNLDFKIQHSILTEVNTKLRPDAIVFLPGNNLMVIDAKASRFLLESKITKINEIDAQSSSLDNDKNMLDNINNNLAKTMNNHLKSLMSKDYAENILTDFHRQEQNTIHNIITLMFLPTEYAVEKLLEIDKSFLDKAWAANIFPVGPSGLMNMLSFAKFQVVDQLRSANYQLIIEEVRKLLLSVHSITEHSQKLGNNIQNLVNNYDKFAASFNRNFLSRIKNIQKLGIDNSSKNINLSLDRYHVVTSKSDAINYTSLDLSEATNTQDIL